MRILIVQETNWIDRNVIHQHHLGERLVQRGHAVQVIDYDILWHERERRSIWRSRQVYSDVCKVIPGASLEVIRPATLQLPLFCHLSWTASSLNEIRRIVKENHPDVVIGLSLTNSYPMALMLRSYQIPYISMVLEPYHSMVPQRWAQPIARVFERLALRGADRVVVFTPQMVEYISEFEINRQKISLYKTGVSLELFSPRNSGLDLRAQLGIQREEWVLFFMGWLYEFSGLRQIVGYLNEHPQALSGARLLILGDGDIFDELSNQVKDSGLAEKVILAGKVPYTQVPPYLAASDVCLMSSLENNITREIVPMKVYEYLAAGKPVVSTNLPGMRAEFGDGNGVLYASDPIKVLQASLALRHDPDKAHSLSQEGRQMAERNADWEVTADRFEQLLIEVSSGNGRVT